MKIKVGTLVRSQQLGLCRVAGLNSDGTCDLEPLWMKGDVLIDDSGNPIGLVEADTDVSADSDERHLCHLRYTVPVAPGTTVHNVSLEQRLALANREDTNAALAKLGL